MADLPIYNPRLDIQATAFRRHAPWTIGVVSTPWFMNLVAVPDDAGALPAPGATVELALPAGAVEAVVADLPGFGRFVAASMFSPMHEFDDPAATRAVAEAALQALFRVEPPRVLDRRSLLGGRRDGAR